jgi:hypothetical protein
MLIEIPFDIVLEEAHIPLLDPNPEYEWVPYHLTQDELNKLIEIIETKTTHQILFKKIEYRNGLEGEDKLHLDVFEENLDEVQLVEDINNVISRYFNRFRTLPFPADSFEEYLERFDISVGDLDYPYRIEQMVPPAYIIFCHY